MNAPTPEFSRLVALAGLGATPFYREIEATPDECARLARRFGLVSLDRLKAFVTLRRMSGELIRLEATFEAAFVQDCVVTLEPVPGTVSQAFSLLYGPPQDDEIEIALDAEEPVFEPLCGDAIDIAEAVAQELSLALPDFPRDPNAAIDAAFEPEPEDGPFAGLDKLRGPARD